MNIRDNRIDSVKGALILLVIFGHMIEKSLSQYPVLERVYNFIYLFHMPAFIFISGFLSGWKGAKLDSVIRNIIIPFLVFSVIYEIVDVIHNDGSSFYLKTLTPNWILWFLFSMAVWKLLAPLINKFKFSLFATVVISVLVSLTNYTDYYSFSAFRTIVFFPFYLLGVQLACRFDNKVPNLESKYAIAFSLLVLILLVLINLPFNRFLLYGVAPFKAYGYSNQEGSYLRVCYYFAATIAIFSFIVLTSKMTFLSNIGRNSIFIYLWHGLIVKYLLWQYLPFKDLSIQATLTIAALTSMILSYFLSRPFIVHPTKRIFNFSESLLIKKAD